MPRRKSVNLIRDVGVDSLYGSELVQKLINVVMWRGKKNVARTIVYTALDLLGKKGGGHDKSVRLLQKAIEQVTPIVEVQSRRVGGGVYQVPTEVSSHRARSLALRWLVQSAGQRSDKTMGLRLGYELLEASEGRGAAVKKKTNVHQMAEANRAFAHYAWK
jgi:small subunit ribosomal protein S7